MKTLNRETFLILIILLAVLYVLNRMYSNLIFLTNSEVKTDNKTATKNVDVTYGVLLEPETNEEYEERMHVESLPDNIRESLAKTHGR